MSTNHRKYGAIATIGCALGVACVDTTPVLVIDPNFDAAIDVPEASSEILSKCLACLDAPDVPGPGCADEVAACRANVLCARLFDCAVANGCFLLPTRSEFIECGGVCATDAGVPESDPAVALGTSIDVCIELSCASVCPPYEQH